VNDHRARNVYVAKADGPRRLETDEQVYGGVCIGCGGGPDGKGKGFVVGFAIGGGGEEK